MASLQFSEIYFKHQTYFLAIWNPRNVSITRIVRIIDIKNSELTIGMYQSAQHSAKNSQFILNAFSRFVFLFFTICFFRKRNRPQMLQCDKMSDNMSIHRFLVKDRILFTFFANHHVRKRTRKRINDQRSFPSFFSFSSSIT